MFTPVNHGLGIVLSLHSTSDANRLRSSISEKHNDPVAARLVQPVGKRVFVQMVDTECMNVDINLAKDPVAELHGERFPGKLVKPFGMR